MKIKKLTFKKGFTLMETIVVVLIISILASIAISAYVLSAEQSRMSEAELWLGTVRLSQQRYRMSSGGRYARYWKSLDISKRGPGQDVTSNTPSFCTRGTAYPTDENCTSSGYKITLYGSTSLDSGVVAQRVNSGRYSYKLAQFYKNDDKQLLCVAGTEHPDEDKKLCPVFLGLDEYDESAEALVQSIEQADQFED